MSETVPTPGAGAGDARLRPARLLAYYLLLLVFIVLTDLLLEELAGRYDLEQFEKTGQIVKLAFDHSAAFDDVVHTVFSLFLSLVFTLPVAWVYTLTKEEERFDPSLVQTIVVLSMVVTGVMIVIGTDLARAFGLAGVVAAVRFRNTLEDAKDAVYVFIAIAIGMACGTRAYPIAVWVSVVMTATMFVLWRYGFGRLLRASSSGRAGAREGKKGKKIEALQWLRDETSEPARDRARRAFEQQLRLLQFASLASNKDKKKATAAVLVDSSDLGAAQRHVDAALKAFGGKWRLAGVSAGGNGHGVLEYVGRLPKQSTPAALVAVLRQRLPQSCEAIEFRALKGLRAPAAVSEAERGGRPGPRSNGGVGDD